MCFITVQIHLCYSVVKKITKSSKTPLGHIHTVRYIQSVMTQCLLILLLRKIETSKTLYFYDVMFTTLEITLTMKNLNFKSSWTCEFECCVTMTKSDMSVLHTVRYGNKNTNKGTN